MDRELQTRGQKPAKLTQVIAFRKERILRRNSISIPEILAKLVKESGSVNLLVGHFSE